MNDETPLVDEASLLVTSLKQHALMKIAKTLIRSDLENFSFFDGLVSDKALQRFSDSIKQLGIPKSCQNDIQSAISGLYRHLQNGAISRANSLTPSTVKFNVRGDVDVHRTFDDCMEHICRWPRAPRQYLYKFLEDACRFHQEQCVHVMLCELAKWKGSGLEPLLRNARPEVEVLKQAEWHYDISFVIEDLVDPAPWKSFVTMLNNNLEGIMFSFDENILKVSTQEFSRHGKMALLWSKMTTIVKFEHAAEIFKTALDQSDTCLLVQTMHYLDSTNRMHLIKTDLVPFILCFLTHPYYRHILPDLQLAQGGVEVLVLRDVHSNLERMLLPLEDVGDYTNFLDCLVQLWKYICLRHMLVGAHVHNGIRSFLQYYEDRISAWCDNELEEDDAKEAFTKLHEIFLNIIYIVIQ